MMRDALRDRADVAYAEYSGGHDHVCWRQALPEQFIELLGSNQAGLA